jgi:hypothetical protein
MSRAINVFPLPFFIPCSEEEKDPYFKNHNSVFLIYHLHSTILHCIPLESRASRVMQIEKILSQNNWSSWTLAEEYLPLLRCRVCANYFKSAWLLISYMSQCDVIALFAQEDNSVLHFVNSALTSNNAGLCILCTSYSFSLGSLLNLSCFLSTDTKQAPSVIVLITTAEQQ